MVDRDEEQTTTAATTMSTTAKIKIESRRIIYNFVDRKESEDIDRNTMI
jgi:hypothetical protein